MEKLIIKPNGYYEGIIKSLYAGNEGEILTFLQEMYQANLVFPFEKQQYEFLQKLFTDDIEHTKRLAEILVLMGADPKLINTQNIWLSGKSIDYVKSYKQILYTNLELKEKIIIDYKTALNKISDNNINLILSLNLEDEILHKNMIIRQIEKLKY
ncbi:MAG: hypothetical protein E7376_01740 [Clostridiales bacterium]|nr:hypothetical protein [Clostridiales bacterium]